MDQQMDVRAILTGTPVLFRGTEKSAIAKRPVVGMVRIDRLGIVGDAVADQRYHGGPDKALHSYPHDHYSHWRERIGDHPLLAEAGAFGENLSTFGMDERDCCIGDRFRLGSALVEVSHGRQPCWKIDHRFGHKGMMAHIVDTAMCGLYFRVIEEGEAQAGEPMRLIARQRPEWPVARVFALLIGSAGKDDPVAVRALAREPLLAEAWRERAAKRAR